mgnify:CR=1 FL=1
MSLAQVFERDTLAVAGNAEKTDLAPACLADDEISHARRARARIKRVELFLRKRDDIACLVFAEQESRIVEIAAIAKRDSHIGGKRHFRRGGGKPAIGQIVARLH